MNLLEIAASIASWNDLRTEKDSAKLTALFAKGNSFFYKAAMPEQPGSAYVHVYPGVGSNGSLQLFVIEESRDTLQQSKSDEGILPYIAVCSLAASPGLGSEIPEQEALSRIEGWKENRASWIQSQLETEDSIFQAFAIPSDDIAYGQELQVYFALKPGIGAGPALADLIVFDKDQSGKLLNASKYFDLVRPVPPFHIDGPLDKEKFYLLQIS